MTETKAGSFDPEAACLHVRFPDGSRWNIPLIALARHDAEQIIKNTPFTRATKRADLDLDVIVSDLLERWKEDPRQVLAYSANLRWASVAKDAVQVKSPDPPDEETLENFWLSGTKQILAGNKR